MKIAPNLKWVVVLRHAKAGKGDILTPESSDYIAKLSERMRKRFDPHIKISMVFTSLETRGVLTGNYFAQNVGASKTVSLVALAGDRYSDGSKLSELVMDNVDEDTEVIIIVGHYTAVLGIASALIESFDIQVDDPNNPDEPDPPENLEGVVINAQTGEFTIGIKKFFGIS